MNVVLALTGLVTPLIVTVTLFVPSVALARIVNVAEIEVVLFTTMLLAETPLLPVLIVVGAPAVKFVPVRVTGTLVPCTPLDGVTELRVGVDGLTVKVALGLTGLVTPLTVTVTLFVPSVALARIVNVAEIEVVLFTTMLLAETPLLPVLIVVGAPAVKFVPVRVTGTLVP